MNDKYQVTDYILRLEKALRLIADTTFDPWAQKEALKALEKKWRRVNK